MKFQNKTHNSQCLFTLVYRQLRITLTTRQNGGKDINAQYTFMTTNVKK